MNGQKFFRWIVEIEVSENLVADGVDVTSEMVQRMLSHHLPFTSSHELRARVLARPQDDEVAAAQGYGSVTLYRQERKL